MHPIHDVDSLLILATALAAKRHAAELAEIMAAAELIQGAIPAEAKLAEAFRRLSAHGLIREETGRFALTPAAQTIVGDQPRQKGELKDRLVGIKQALAAYKATGELDPIELTTEQVSAAILAHRSFLTGPGKNLLVPKPTADDDKAKRPGLRQRKPLPARRRKP